MAAKAKAAKKDYEPRADEYPNNLSLIARQQAVIRALTSVKAFMRNHGETLDKVFSSHANAVVREIGTKQLEEVRFHLDNATAALRGEEGLADEE
jgi:ribosomal protein S12